MNLDASAAGRWRGLWITIGVALASRLVIVFTVPPGYPGDMAGWVETAQRISREGLANSYAVLAPGSLYPPAFMYPLWAAGHFYQWCCSPDFEPATRSLDQVMLLGPVIADTMIAVLVYVLAARWLSPNRALAAGLLYALSPAALTTIAWQGMIGDAYYGALVLAALVAALDRRPILTAVCLTLGVLVKPQGLALCPLVALVALRYARPAQILGAVAASAVTAVAVLLPFAVSGKLDTLEAAIQAMSSIHAYTQNSADNLWLLLQLGEPSARVSYLDGAVPDSDLFFAGLSYAVVGLLMFAVVYAGTLLGVLVAHVSARAVTISGAVVGLAFFFFNTRMHVNYSFMAFPFLCILAAAGGWPARLALATTTLACLVDWDAFGRSPWPEGLPVHQASAALYGVGLVLVCSVAVVPAARRVGLLYMQSWGRRRVAHQAPRRDPVPIKS